jgi:hypothetical protein
MMGPSEAVGPPEAEKKAAQGVRAGDVGAPVTPELRAPPVGKRKKKLWMMKIHLDLLEP